MTYTIGLDLGGTKIAGCLCDSKGQAVKKLKAASFEFGHRPQDVVQQMVELTKQLRVHLPAKARLKGVGLASAGPLDVLKGELIHPVNIPGWKRVPLVKLLSEKLKKPVSFQNDAIAAALGEGWTGRAKELDTYVVITVGTGIGTGLIINGQPCQTAGTGSEWGHMLVFDKPGSAYGTVENHASGTALYNKAKKLGFRGQNTFDLVAAVKKNPRARYATVFDEAAEALAHLCYNLSIGTGLQKIIVSGGLSKEKALYLDLTRQRYRELIRPQMKLFECPIVGSSLGEWAGAIGAARLPHLK